MHSNIPRQTAYCVYGRTYCKHKEWILRRRRELFWGLVLIALGIILWIAVALQLNVWRLVGPAVLILLGLWTLLAKPRRGQFQEATIAMEGAEQAQIRLKHGAGELTVRAGAGPTSLLSGSFSGGANITSNRSAGALEVEIAPPSGRAGMWLPIGLGSRGMDWDILLNPDVMMSLTVESGASRIELDLEEMQLEALSLQTGASSARVILPSQAGSSRVKIDSGMAAVSVWAPDGVATQIRAEGGLAAISVDEQRFPRQGRIYRSVDYDTAENRVEMVIKTGMGSIDVR